MVDLKAEEEESDSSSRASSSEPEISANSEKGIILLRKLLECG